MAERNKKILLIIAIVLAVMLCTMLTIKGLSQEDDWICQDGQWIQHGYPSAPKPLENCAR